MAEKFESVWDALPNDGTEAAPVAPEDVPATPEAPTAPVVPTGGKRQKSFKARMSEAFIKEDLATEENKQKWGKWSPALEVINSLGFSNKGSFVDDTNDKISAAVAAGIVTVVPEDDTETACYVDVKGKDIVGGTVRKKGDGYYKPFRRDENGNPTDDQFTSRMDVPLLVGYLIQNIGSEPISIYNSVCVPGEDQRPVAGPVQMQMLNPGETAAISKKNLMLTSAQLEFSGKFHNGLMASKKPEEGADVNKIMDSAHFIFYKEYAGQSVQEAPFKVSISVDDENGIPKIKDEYKPQFAYLETLDENKRNRAAARAAGGTKGQKPTIDNSDILAKLIRDKVLGGQA